MIVSPISVIRVGKAQHIVSAPLDTLQSALQEDADSSGCGVAEHHELLALN